MKKIVYLVSMKDALESFIYREIECLKQRGFNISVYSIFKDKGGHFSPKNIVDVYNPSVIGVLIALAYYLINEPIKLIKNIKLAIRYKVFIELLLSLPYSKKMSHDNVTNLQVHFGDKKYFIGYFCKQFSGVNLSLTVHAHELYANPNNEFFRFSIKSADKIVCISEKNKQLLTSMFDVSSDRSEVIRLSIDLSEFSHKTSVKFLSVGRYTERKGFDDLFQAFSRLKDIENIELITVGWGDLDLDKLAEKHGITDRVRVFGKMNQNQLAFFYQNCHVFCLASKTTESEGQEGIPVVLMEAMASEMQIVTTKNGSIPELVDEFLANEESIDEIENGLRAAYHNVVSGKFPNTLARKKVISEYSENNIDKLVEYLYG